VLEAASDSYQLIPMLNAASVGALLAADQQPTIT
jgi:hypothetical protein